MEDRGWVVSPADLWQYAVRNACKTFISSAIADSLILGRLAIPQVFKVSGNMRMCTIGCRKYCFAGLAYRYRRLKLKREIPPPVMFDRAES